MLRLGESADAIARARGWVDAHGGTAEVVAAFGRGDPAVVYVALAGLIEPVRAAVPADGAGLIRRSSRSWSGASTRGS